MGILFGSDGFLFLPGWHQPQQECQDQERKGHPHDGHEKALGTDQAQLEICKPMKAFGKKLPADHHVPPHEKDPDQDQYSRYEVNGLSRLFFYLGDLDDPDAD
jgi:hypothetical protein